MGGAEKFIQIRHVRNFLKQILNYETGVATAHDLAINEVNSFDIILTINGHHIQRIDKF